MQTHWQSHLFYERLSIDQWLQWPSRRLPFCPRLSNSRHLLHDSRLRYSRTDSCWWMGALLVLLGWERWGLVSGPQWQDGLFFYWIEEETNYVYRLSAMAGKLFVSLVLGISARTFFVLWFASAASTFVFHWFCSVIVAFSGRKILALSNTCASVLLQLESLRAGTISSVFVTRAARWSRFIVTAGSPIRVKITINRLLLIPSPPVFV